MTLKRWSVGSAVLRQDDGILLVRNRRRGGIEDWSTPGGVIDDGEAVIEGIAREVAEETGITVVDWSHHLYSVMVTAPDLGWQLTVQVWEASSHSGPLTCGNDPDGIVIDGQFCGVEYAAELLESSPAWVREPLLEHFSGSPFESGPMSYRYTLSGTSPDSWVVSRGQ